LRQVQTGKYAVLTISFTKFEKLSDAYCGETKAQVRNHAAMTQQNVHTMPK